jgi:hypothetical protein
MISNSLNSWSLYITKLNFGMVQWNTLNFSRVDIQLDALELAINSYRSKIKLCIWILKKNHHQRTENIFVGVLLRKYPQN